MEHHTYMAALGDWSNFSKSFGKWDFRRDGHYISIIEGLYLSLIILTPSVRLVQTSGPDWQPCLLTYTFDGQRVHWVPGGLSFCCYTLFLFSLHNNYRATQCFLFGKARCHAYHTLLALSGVLTTFTGKPGIICTPTMLPSGHTCLSGQAFRTFNTLWMLRTFFLGT